MSPDIPKPPDQKTQAPPINIGQLKPSQANTQAMPPPAQMTPNRNMIALQMLRQGQDPGGY